MTYRCGLFLSVLAVFSTPALAGGISATIGISGFTYTNSPASIPAGETVAIAASGFHPLRLDAVPDFACASKDGCQITFLRPASYGFFCFNHGGPAGVGMAGSVTVTATDTVFAGTFQYTVQ